MEYETFLEKLLINRRRKTEKQSEIAKKMGISQAQYSNLENGKSEITVRQLIKICEIINIDIKDLF